MTKDPIRPSEALPLGADASAELQPLFGDPTNDWAALYEIADVIRKALRDPEFIRLANEPDTDKSSRVEGEDTPESAHMRCVAAEAINAVLNRTKISSITGNVVSMDVVAAGHSDDRAISVANLALSNVVARWRRTKHRNGPSALQAPFVILGRQVNGAEGASLEQLVARQPIA